MLKMVCIYCNKFIPVEHLLYKNELPSLQKIRLEFEVWHDEHCGPKSIAIIGDLNANNS